MSERLPTSGAAGDEGLGEAALSPELAHLFASERDAPEPPAVSRKRVWGRVAATVGLGAVSLAGTEAARHLVARLGLFAVAAALVGGGAWLKFGDRSSLPSSITVAAAPTAPIPVVAPTPSAALAARALVAAPAAAALPSPSAPIAQPALSTAPSTAGATETRRASPAARNAGDPVVEYQLLEQARRALAQGDWRGALAAAQAHEKRFPGGQLVEERESLAVRALASGHQDAEARRRALRFQRRFQSSIFMPAVEAALRSLP